MPTPLIDAPHYPQIRALLDVGLDATVLPDTVLAMDVHVPAAIDAVKARDPLAEDRAGDALKRVQRAAVYFAAALVAPAVPRYVSEQFPEYKYSREAANWAARAAELRALADAELDLVLDPGDVAIDRPRVFALAHGRRGR